LHGNPQSGALEIRNLYAEFQKIISGDRYQPLAWS
jgi:hypothetical protein